MKGVPSSFKLMSFTIRVKVVPKKDWKDKNSIGLFDPERKIILIKNQNAAINRQVFWHEAVHAMLDTLSHGLYEDEAFVDQLGGLLAQIMDSCEP